MSNDSTLELLKGHVFSAADALSTVGFREGEELEEYGELNAGEWLSEQLDIEYRVYGDGDYKSTGVLITVGGPRIWVDTSNNQVHGAWGGEHWSACYEDVNGVDEYLADVWEMTRG